MKKNKDVKSMALTAPNSAKKIISTTVNEFVGVSKATTTAIHKDVDELLVWLEKRNDSIQNETEGWDNISYEKLPTLGKVIVSGEDGINQLPNSKKKAYTEYFKKNATRIAVLTAINPLFGISIAGLGAAASGAVSSATGIGASAIGAGLLGTGAVASLLTPVGYTTWAILKTFVPAARLVGIGFLLFGAGAALFKSVEKLPQGKKIIELYEKTQKLYDECQSKLEKNINEIGKVLSEKIKIASEKLEATSKKIAITIDDAIHSDQNLRLMQYQQIVLDLYNNQNEIRATLEELTNNYNKLQEENAKLAKKIVEYSDILQTLAHSSEYLK